MNIPDFRFVLRPALFTVLITLSLGQNCIEAPQGVITELGSGWQNIYLGSETDVPFFPDGHAVYLDYRFVTTQEPPLGIRIQGAFPSARYLGISVYDNARFTVHNRIADAEIVPDDGSRNPFAEGIRSTGGDSYTIDVVPEGLVPAESRNVVTYDPSIADVSIFIRYYLPEDGVTGNVPIPVLSAFDASTAEAMPLPDDVPRTVPGDGQISRAVRTVFRDLFVQHQINTLFSLGERRILRAYRFGGEGLYANGDTSYLGMLIRKDRDEVALIRFRPPSFAATPALNATADVRYWSISQGNDRSYNVFTLADFEFLVADDGHVYLAVAEDGPDLRRSIGRDNFMPWLAGERGIMVFRHLVTHPGFTHGFSQVPAFDPEDPAGARAAGEFIGAYAPIGVLVTRTQFIRDGFKPIRFPADVEAR